MELRKKLMLVVAVLGAIGFTSCTMNAAGGGIASYQAYDRPAKLPKDPSAVIVKVSLSKQRVYVMEGGEMLMAMPVTVGAAETATPEGDFRIYEKDLKRREGANGSAGKGLPLPYWCGFSPGFGFHTGWVKHHPSSNGCIRMHENLAPKFFRLVSIGTPVSVAYHQPEDAKWANMALFPDAGPLPDYEKSMYLGDDYFTHHKTPVFD
jgi:hypothetical protein